MYYAGYPAPHVCVIVFIIFDSDTMSVATMQQCNVAQRSLISSEIDKSYRVVWSPGRALLSECGSR
jgi:hypothetical protein